MRRNKVLAIAAVLILLMGTLMTGCSSSETSVEVKCTNGVMQGVVVDGVQSFKGVPFAQSPVGDLRWKAPVAPEPSDEVIDCSEYGDTAIQYEWFSESASFTEKSEDCLTLNIWAAEGSEEPKAVMVWIHGGAHGWGGTNDALYDGQNFVKAHPEIIYVSVNYRLGVMGWPEFSQIEGGEEYTDVNLGIRDNIMALEWIQENIAAFGGDPDNVTIFGESAGGSNVSALMISPAAEGLFDKAIAQSGVVNQGMGTREDAQEYGNYIAEEVGAKTMDDLLAITSDEWIEYDTELWLADYNCGPVIDGEIIPEDVYGAVKEAGSSGIPLMLGCTTDEYNYWIAEWEGYEYFEEALTDHMDETYDSMPAEGDALVDEFIKMQMDQGLDQTLANSRYVTEGWRYSHIKYAEEFTAGGGEAYMYLWNVPSNSDTYLKSACHAVDLAYVLNNLEETIFCGDDPDPVTAERTQEAWVNFAKTGNPSIEAVEWPQYDATDRNTMKIEVEEWTVESDPLSESRQMFEQLRPYQEVLTDWGSTL